MAEVVERVANLEGRFDAQAKQLDNIQESLLRLEGKMERRFDAVDRRFTGVENRVTGLETRITALEASTNTRFNAVDNRFDGLERRMEKGFTEVRQEMRWYFRWMMGVVAGAAITVITTILGAMFAKDWL